MKGLFRRKT